ncbi:MAG TPA: hypothetical protein VEV61_11630 [Streptosporangiaceae bacterium]|nr:hypothetical protein [Streptosporangiaceae bacterium]
MTDQVRDERYHATLTVEHAGSWQIDLTLLGIYTALLDDGVRTRDQFAGWLAQRGMVT